MKLQFHNVKDCFWIYTSDFQAQIQLRLPYFPNFRVTQNIILQDWTTKYIFMHQLYNLNTEYNKYPLDALKTYGWIKCSLIAFAVFLSGHFMNFIDIFICGNKQISNVIQTS